MKTSEEEKQKVRKAMLTDLGLAADKPKRFEMKDLTEEHAGLIALMRDCMENTLEDYTKVNTCNVEYWAARVVDLTAASEKTKLREVESLNAELESVKAELGRKCKEANTLKRKLATSEGRVDTVLAERGLRRDKIARLKRELATSERSRKEAEKVAELFRLHLDDSAEKPDDDNEWEQEARRITWNKLDVDNEQQEARIWSMSGKRL